MKVRFTFRVSMFLSFCIFPFSCSRACAFLRFLVSWFLCFRSFMFSHFSSYFSFSSFRVFRFPRLHVFVFSRFHVFVFVCFRNFVISSFLMFMFSHFHVVTLSSNSSFSPLLTPSHLISSHSCLRLVRADPAASKMTAFVTKCM